MGTEEVKKEISSAMYNDLYCRSPRTSDIWKIPEYLPPNPRILDLCMVYISNRGEMTEKERDVILKVIELWCTPAYYVGQDKA